MISLVFASTVGYSQKTIDKTEFKIADIFFLLERHQAATSPEGMCEIANHLKLIQNGKNVYKTEICAAELEDVKIVERGYLTVVHHYSSPVGWSQYYVIDFCKRRILLTKRFDEHSGFTWEEFIDFGSDFKEMYIQEILAF